MGTWAPLLIWFGRQTLMNLEDGTRTKKVKNRKRDSSKLSQIPAMNPLEENCCRFLHVLLLFLACFFSCFLFLLRRQMVCPVATMHTQIQRFTQKASSILLSTYWHECDEIWNGQKSYHVTCTRETKEKLNEEETGDQQCLIVTFGRIPWRGEGDIYWDLQLGLNRWASSMTPHDRNLLGKWSSS